jgi:Raf kinase inhibitor-like YbhB/YbcL family protein
MSFELTSTAFQHGQPIPRKYTADGRDVSPPLKWTDPPAGAKSLALVCEDPDAPRGTWTHWVIFNLPAESRELADSVPPEETLANGTTQGVNDFGRVGYGGPAPPPPGVHRYFFRLFALDRRLHLPAGAGKDQLQTALRRRALAEAELMGTYARGQGQVIPDDPLVKKQEQDRASIYTAPLS